MINEDLNFKAKLYDWKTRAMSITILMEIQDKRFREMRCINCTPEMRVKRKCEEEVHGRTFCNNLVKARERNKLLKRFEIFQTFSSPYIERYPFLRKVAESLYTRDKVL